MTVSNLISPARPPRLLFRFRPDKAESLAGYLLRLADANYMHHAHELLEYLQQKRERRDQGSFTPQLGVYSLDPICLEVGISAEEFAWWCKPMDTLNNRYRKFLHHGCKWPVHLLRNQYRAWCPACLREKALHLSVWDWHLTTYCHKHQALLVDRCPACQQRVKWRYSQLRYCSCGFPLYEGAFPIVPGGNTLDIESLSPTELQRFITLALLMHSPSSSQLDISLLAKSDVAQLHLTLTAIPPEQLLDATQFEKAVCKQLDVRLFQQPTWGSRYAASPLLGGLQIDAVFDEELSTIADNWMKALPLDATAGAPHSVTTQTALPIGAVAITLNVTAHVVRRLIKKEVLIGLADTACAEQRRRQSHMVSGESLARLLQALSTTTCRDTQGKLVRFDHFGIDFATRLNLFKDVLNGSLAICTFDPRIGLPSVELIIPEKHTNNPNRMNVGMVAKALGIYTDAVYRVAKAGLLRYEPYRRRQLLISIEDLQAFHREYVFVRELAQQLGCNATNLADKLMSAGVQAVHGPAIDGGLVYVFRRSELDHLDLNTIAASSIYHSRCGRGHKRPVVNNDISDLLTHKAACQLLGITPSQLDKICRSGLLSPSHTETHGSQVTYSIEAVEAYRIHYQTNPNLITRHEAEAITNSKGIRFRFDVLRQGLVIQVFNGIEIRYKKDELEKAIDFLQSTVDTKKLASITGVSLARTRWEAKYGCLAGMAVHTGYGVRRFLFPLTAISVLRGVADSRKPWKRRKESADVHSILRSK